MANTDSLPEAYNLGVSDTRYPITGWVEPLNDQPDRCSDVAGYHS
jgi:hypothetical protein